MEKEFFFFFLLFYKKKERKKESSGSWFSPASLLCQSLTLGGELEPVGHCGDLQQSAAIFRLSVVTSR